MNRQRNLDKRMVAERRFIFLSRSAVLTSIGVLFILLASISWMGIGAVYETRIVLDIDLNEVSLDEEDSNYFANFNYNRLLRKSLRELLYQGKDRLIKRELYALLNPGGYIDLYNLVMEDKSVIGKKIEVAFLASGMADNYFNNRIDLSLPEERRPITDRQIKFLEELAQQGRLISKLNTTIIKSGASSYAPSAGMGVAIIGSIYMMLIVLIVSLPLGVCSAIYLEEFAPSNRLTDIIEVNINNLAAIPSIVFGVFGLAIFINFMQLPRSAPLVGGLVLSLMTLPTIIIASRSALRSIPPSLKESALALGASHMQVIFHHILPAALPGILTGSIIGLAQALGETAPLLMIGMVAFVVDYPASPLDPASALPVQIYMWASMAERAFLVRAAAAIMVLLIVMICLNALAVYLRNRFEIKW